MLSKEQKEELFFELSSLNSNRSEVEKATDRVTHRIMGMYLIKLSSDYQFLDKYISEKKLELNPDKDKLWWATRLGEIEGVSRVRGVLELRIQTTLKELEEYNKI